MLELWGTLATIREAETSNRTCYMSRLQQALRTSTWKPPTLSGGSWVVISGVIHPLIWVITIVTLLITLLIATHEPPSIAPLSPLCPVASQRSLGSPIYPGTPK